MNTVGEPIILDDAAILSLPEWSVLVVTGECDLDVLQEQLAESLRGRGLRTITIIVKSPEINIEALDEDQMRMAGWVRVGRPGGTGSVSVDIT